VFLGANWVFLGVLGVFSNFWVGSRWVLDEIFGALIVGVPIRHQVKNRCTDTRFNPTQPLFRLMFHS